MIQPSEDLMHNEPVITGASVLAFVAAVVTLLVAFGVDISADQQKAVLSVVAIAGPVVVAVFVRRRVTPVGVDR